MLWECNYYSDMPYMARGVGGAVDNVSEVAREARALVHAPRGDPFTFPTSQSFVQESPHKRDVLLFTNRRDLTFCEF